MKNTSTKKTVKQNGAVKGNLVEKLTLEVLNEKHNALARCIGIPCVVDASAIIDGAPTDEGEIKQIKDFACYRVDLQYFNGEFSKIRFRAATNGDDVVFGFIVDNDGKVECFAQGGEPFISTVTLPLTGKSRTLYAAMPAQNGKPQWTNVKVKLLSDGIISDVSRVFKNLQSQISTLEQRLENVLSGRNGSEECACLC